MAPCTRRPRESAPQAKQVVDRASVHPDRLEVMRNAAATLSCRWLRQIDDTAVDAAGLSQA